MANQRIEWLARSLRRRLGSGVLVRRVQYRVRGWNSAELDALRDAATALDSMREHFDAAKIVVVGHSMGGRVAAHLSASGNVGAAVALAPWWPRVDASSNSGLQEACIGHYHRSGRRCLVALSDPLGRSRVQL